MTDAFISFIADGAVVPVVLIGAASLLFCVPNSEKYRSYSRILMAGLTAYLAAKLIGAVYQPEVLRPFQQLGVDAGASFLDNPGFPSDHVLFCMAITLAVWFETRQRALVVILFSLTIIVGIGRVLALVHTPLDVAGGMIIACAGIPWYFVDRSSVTPSRKKHKKAV